MKILKNIFNYCSCNNILVDYFLKYNNIIAHNIKKNYHLKFITLKSFKTFT